MLCTLHWSYTFCPGIVAQSLSENMNSLFAKIFVSLFGFDKKTGALGEYTSITWTVVLILFVRGFIVEPFQIPSGSMIPTLLVGDRLFVAKSSYDIGIPFTNIKVLKVSDPKRGDVAVFEYPNYENDLSKQGYYYIKRIVGIPGDTISVKGGVPHLNGKAFQQTEIEYESQKEFLPEFKINSFRRLFQETVPDADGGPHWVHRKIGVMQRSDEIKDRLLNMGEKDCVDFIAFSNRVPFTDFGETRYISTNEVCEFKIPENKYFVMGDNRDDSADSREWGFVERKLLKGRALFIWASVRPVHGSLFDDEMSDLGEGDISLGDLLTRPQDIGAWWKNWDFRISRFGLAIR
jgi:signal peptidase I